MSDRARTAVRLYGEGRTTREIAAELGIDAETVRRSLAAEAVKLRRSGPRGRIDIATETITELRDEQHMSWRQIADATGLSRTAVRKRYARDVSS